MQNTMKSPLLDNDYNEKETEANMNKTNRDRISKSISFDFENKTSANVSIVENPTHLNHHPNSSNLLSSPLSLHSNVTVLNSTGSALLCRICYTSDNIKEALIQPCNCSGTMGLMHRGCLEKWLAQSNKSRCEICNFEFIVLRKPRSFEEWLLRPISTKDNKNLLNDFVCFLILTPLAIVSTWYCAIFAAKFTESENKWESSGLVVLTSFLLVIYILWLIFSFRYHFKVFREWQKKNQIVSLKIDDSRVLANSSSVLNHSQIKFYRRNKTTSENEPKNFNQQLQQLENDHEQSQNELTSFSNHNASFDLSPNEVHVRTVINPSQTTINLNESQTNTVIHV